MFLYIKTDLAVKFRKILERFCSRIDSTAVVLSLHALHQSACVPESQMLVLCVSRMWLWAKFSSCWSASRSSTWRLRFGGVKVLDLAQTCMFNPLVSQCQCQGQLALLVGLRINSMESLDQFPASNGVF